MTEREKMLAGELCKAWDPELVALRARARRLTRESVFVEPPFFCDYGGNIHAGNNFYMNFDCVILDCARVDIGENVFCGPKVQIYTATHPVQASERIKGPELAKPIRIGNNVWLGGGSILCPASPLGITPLSQRAAW